MKKPEQIVKRGCCTNLTDTNKQVQDGTYVHNVLEDLGLQNKKQCCGRATCSNKPPTGVRM